MSAAGATARTVGAAARATGRWVKRSKNQRALDKYAEFWAALQQVGDALAAIERLSRRADDASWMRCNERHWSIATADEVRVAVKRCRSSLRIVSAQAKRFEPDLIVKDWRR
ncbi:hypothetical protein WEH80_06080 [Actinomycetes bacterium KLBMP 9759]